MSGHTLQVMTVVGSQRKQSVIRTVLRHLSGLMQDEGCSIDVLDLGETPLPLYNPDTTPEAPHFAALKGRVNRADVLILGTPDYHGSISSTLKNFLDHFWYEFAAKLFVTVIASHEKGLTATDQLRTVARQCNAWTLPYSVSVADKVDVKDGQIVNEGLRKRLEMVSRDARVYGQLLARQRQADFDCQDNCFLARLRPTKPTP
jgi:FMN reductase